MAIDGALEADIGYDVRGEVRRLQHLVPVVVHRYAVFLGNGAGYVFYRNQHPAPFFRTS